MDNNYFIDRYPFKNKPFVHQGAYLQRFWEDKNVAVLAEMGTGKSFMLINNRIDSIVAKLPLEVRSIMQTIIKRTLALP